MLVSIRTKNTAIAFFRFKDCTTTGALINRHSIIIWHFFQMNMATIRAGEFCLVLNFHNLHPYSLVNKYTVFKKKNTVSNPSLRRDSGQKVGRELCSASTIDLR